MKNISQKIFDAACILSIVGIWPRFIEPNLIVTTKLQCPIPDLPEDLEGFRVVQFSDLHLGSVMSDRMLAKIQNTILDLKPDLIVFTGDFLCYSRMDPKNRLKDFLNKLSAPYGAFAILGNHDYAEPVLVDAASGKYDAVQRKSGDVIAGLKLLFHPIKVTGQIAKHVNEIDFHHDLSHTLAMTPFCLLHNETCRIPVGKSFLNLVGLGEHMLNRNDPQTAFQDYDPQYPGIVLSHNPDAVPKLLDYPGKLILAGHTHGAQINLPGLWNRFTVMENPHFKRGCFQEKGKMIYVNRGVGSVFPLRLCSPPEITLVTLTRSSS